MICRTRDRVGTRERVLKLIDFRRVARRPGAARLRPPTTLMLGRLRRGNFRRDATKIGGANRDRTDDLKLAKLALSQLSYGPVVVEIWRKWWAWEDLNFRPHAYQARALTN
jgi:hypothetical protein